MSGVVFVTHDLPVLRTVSNRIAIMYAGKIVEVGDAAEITERPRHPYAAALLSAVLVPEPRYRTMRVFGIPGSPPNLANPPSGCRFHPRCGVSYPECSTEEPPHVGDELRFSKCFWAKKHPGEAVPLKAVTSESLDDADPVTGAQVPPESEQHDDLDGPGTGADDHAGSRAVPAGGVTA
jgi:peptide/nickel transport system ATP-binding protein